MDPRSEASFLAALPEALRARAARTPDLGAHLEHLVARARGERPDLAASADAVIEAAARAMTEDDDLGPVLDGLFAGDLLLAALAGRGDPRALAAFDRELGGDLDHAIARSPTLGLDAREFRQVVHTKLFVSEPGDRPKIASYGGRGALRGWVRVIASRAVIDLSRRVEPRGGHGDAELLDRVPAQSDTELAYLRHAYGPLIPAAFAEAVAALEVRERNLLRHRYLHDVSASSLAGMYGVHRATMFEWLEAARARLQAGVRAALSRSIPGHALESVAAMLGSELELSVRRMLDSKLEAE